MTARRPDRIAIDEEIILADRRCARRLCRDGVDGCVFARQYDVRPVARRSGLRVVGLIVAALLARCSATPLSFWTIIELGPLSFALLVWSHRHPGRQCEQTDCGNQAA
jgi:hypothetical protein